MDARRERALCQLGPETKKQARPASGGKRPAFAAAPTAAICHWQTCANREGGARYVEGSASKQEVALQAEKVQPCDFHLHFTLKQSA